jgi:hypothetical protein
MGLDLFFRVIIGNFAKNEGNGGAVRNDQKLPRHFDVTQHSISGAHSDVGLLAESENER